MEHTNKEFIWKHKNELNKIVHEISFTIKENKSDMKYNISQLMCDVVNEASIISGFCKSDEKKRIENIMTCIRDPLNWGYFSTIERKLNELNSITPEYDDERKNELNFKIPLMNKSILVKIID